MSKYILKVILFVVFFALALPVWSQTSEILDNSYRMPLSNVEILYPMDWTIEDFSSDGGANVRLYEIDFDRTSGQEPRGVIIQAKEYVKLGDETIEVAFTELADLNDQSGLEPSQVEDSQLQMLRADTEMVGNVALGVVVIDSGVDRWIYLQIMNADKPIVETILANISSIPIDESDTMESDTDANYSVVMTALGDRKIDVVKAVRKVTELGLGDTKTLVETVPPVVVLADVTLDVAESAQVELELAGATIEIRDGDGNIGDAEMAESSGIDVVMTAVGDRKIEVIKTVRGLTGLGLADGKDLVETEPEAVILTGVDAEVAEAAKLELETAGATVELRGGEMASEDFLGSIALEEASIEIFYPAGWIIDSTSVKHNLYEFDSDRTSGQQPDGMVVEIQWYQKIPGETLEQAYEFLSGYAALEPTPVEDAQFAMLSADTITDDNVPSELVVIDAADFWVVLNIMQPNDTIVDAMLAQIVLIGVGDMSCSVWVDVIDSSGNVIVSIQAQNGVALDLLVLDMTTVTVNQDSESTSYGGATLQLMSDGCDDVMAGSGLYNVVITDAGASKINVIKAVRGLTGLGLADGKSLVDSAPDAVILMGVTLEVAESAKAELEAEGATVSLIEQP